jgi:hypothetical protein
MFYNYKKKRPPASGYYLHIKGRNWVGEGDPKVYFYDKMHDNWPCEDIDGYNRPPLFWAEIDIPELPILSKINKLGKRYPCQKCIGDYINDNIKDPDPNCDICDGDGLTLHEYEYVYESVKVLKLKD